MPNKEPAALVRAAMYRRISEDSEKRGLGVARQEKECRAKAKQKGWEVVGDFVDNDISGTRKRGKTKERPGYQGLLDALRAGEIDAVLASEQSRLFRDPMELEQFLVICERVGMHRLVTYNGELDIETGEGVLYARIRGAVDAEETRKTGERTRRKHREIAEAGRPSGGGIRPFGYEADKVTVRKSEAREIKRAAEKVLSGIAVRQIVQDLNRRGVGTVKGATWSPETLRDILRNPRIAGLRSLHGEVIAKAVWPAIVSEEDWQRLVAVLGRLSDRKGAVTPRSYLLSGLVTCANCGTRMTATRTSEYGGRYHYRRYRCVKDRGGCGKVSMSADRLEELITEMLFLRLRNHRFEPARRRLHGGDDLDVLLTQLREDEEALSQLAQDHYVDRQLPRSAFLAAKTPLDNRIAVTKERLARTQAAKSVVRVGDAKTLKSRWPAMQFGERRAVVEALVDEIMIAERGDVLNQFDPMRVRLHWRF